MKINIKSFNKWKKRWIAFISDTLATLIAWLAAIILSSKGLLEKPISVDAILIIISTQSIVYILCGLYRGVWRFASIPDLIRIIRAVIIGVMINILLLRINHLFFPIETYIIYSLLVIFSLSSTRLLFRLVGDRRLFFLSGKRVLIVGAGNAGEGIIRDLYRSASTHSYIPAAIVDDDITRHGCEVRGVRVIGSCKDIAKVTEKHKIELILIAIPSASSKRMRQIVQYCEQSKVPFRTLPSLKDIAEGNVTMNTLRNVLIEDLLGREEINLDWNVIKKFISDKIILVTGGGGSIGSELCRQICLLSPKKLIIIDNNEFNLYSIDMELSKNIDKSMINSHLCSVTDKIEIQKIFSIYKPNIVFHAAAFKHVPLLESHLRIAMYNNIIGTKIVADLAEKNKVTSFVLISTDKAVNPTSIMGATKRSSEIYCQTLNMHSSTDFITVRFGNVLDSAGSVIPLFRKQLLEGGPLTVTDQNISRYFMTIPEACQLILQASTMSKQGNLFVLDMGEPIKISYLAEQMIKLSGKKIGQDIEIQYTGLRPGEKLHEELFHSHEDIHYTSHIKIKQAKVRKFDWKSLNIILENIELACYENSEERLLYFLQQLVPEYKNSLKNNTSLNYSLLCI